MTETEQVKAQESKPSDEPSGAKRDSKPTKVLPTDRITFDKQTDIVKAYGAASEHGAKAASLKDIAQLVGMTDTTISLANSWLSSLGLIHKAEGGYRPDESVVNYLRALEWSPESAGTKLATKIGEAWFSKALLPRLSYRPMTEDAALTVLAEAATASRKYERKLSIILDYMQLAGLISKNGDQIQKVTGAAPSPEPHHGVAAQDEKKVATKEHSDHTPRVEPRVSTAYDQTPQGVVNFNVSFKVDMSEVAKWEPSRIAAFFGGIAQVLAAKANVEKV